MTPFEIVIVVIVVFVVASVMRRRGRAPRSTVAIVPTRADGNVRTESVRTTTQGGVTTTVRVRTGSSAAAALDDDAAAARAFESLKSVDLNAVPPAMRPMVEAAMKKAYAAMDGDIVPVVRDAPFASSDAPSLDVVSPDVASTYGGYPANDATAARRPMRQKHAQAPQRPMRPMRAKPPDEPLQPYS